MTRARLAPACVGHPTGNIGGEVGAEGQVLTAAGDAGGGDFFGAESGNLLEGGGDSQLLGGAGDVDGHVVAHLAPLQLVLQKRVYELHRLIQREPARTRTQHSACFSI